MSSISATQLCIHQVTLMQCDFQQSIECLARHGVTKTSLWKEKLDEVGTEEGSRILQDCGVEVVSLCAGGFLTGRNKTQRRESLDSNKRMLEQAHAVGAKSMVTISGGLDADDTDLQAARARALEGLEQLVPVAKDAEIIIALEPLHPMVCGFRSVTTSLGEANDILDSLGSPDGLGIALDSYAVWWDVNLQTEIERAGDRIINFHVSDWLQHTDDIRLDRGMPGDGHINNRQIRQWVEQTGFNGPVEVEIFSANNWWKRPADEVVSTIIDRAAVHL